MTHSAPLLQLDHLRVSLGGRPLIHDLSIELARGETLGLVGASGSGKSLTALAILGLLPPGAQCEGRVLLDGENLLELRESALNALRGRDIGMVFQEPMTALNPLQTIGDQVAEVVRLHRRVSRSAALARAREMLDRVGLPAPHFGLDRYPHELSGGQRQRVAIAMAMVLHPRVLIADEPTTALDVTTQAQILHLLKQLVREEGCGLILVTHDLAVVAQMADQIAVLHEGHLVEQGEAVRVLSAPHAAYTARLLAQSRLPAAPSTTSRPAPPVPLLEVDQVLRTYRQAGPWFRAAQVVRAVDHVSLTVQAGERVGLVGESGCGKSTLLRTILGLEPPQAGEVRLLGRRFSGGERELRRAVQIVFQDPYGSFDPRWRVEALVAEPLSLLPDPPDAATRRQRVEQLLTQVGLQPSDADRFPHEFSGGQRQRIAIARALVTEPALLVLDEAVSALDVAVRAQILALLSRLSQELGLAYLFISHDLAVVRAVTDRVYVMDQGRIVEAGDTAQVFQHPTHACTARLLASTPDLTQALQARTSLRSPAAAETH